MKTASLITIGFCSLLSGCADSNQSKATLADKEIINLTSETDSLYGRITPSVELTAGVILQDTIISQMDRVTPWTQKFMEGSLTINAKTPIDGRAFFVSYHIGTGVGSTNYIMTFVDNQYKDHEIIEMSHDQDLSSAHYEHRVIRKSTARNFVVVDYVETAADKSKVDEKGEWFKDGYDFENVEIKTDSIVLSLKVMNNGMIKRDTLKK